MRKGIALLTVLGVVFLLFIMGTIGFFIVNNEIRSDILNINSVKALRAAQSGVEEALTSLKEGTFSLPQTISGNLNDASYQVTITSIDNGKLQIISIGTCRNAQRKVEVILTKGGVFYPFSINGKFDIERIDSPDWTEALMGVVEIDNNIKSELESANFTVETFPSIPNLPKASNINSNLIFSKLDEEDCDIGSPDEDVHLRNYTDLDGKVICGKNVYLDLGTRTEVDNITVLAAENIYIENEIGDKGRKSDWNVILAAKNDVVFDDKIKFTGKTDGGYNLLVYAGNEIIGNKSSQGIISVTATQNFTKNSSFFFITPGTINLDSTFLWQTGKTKETTNFIMWADKGININDNKSIHLTGSCPENCKRNFALIVADGNVSMKDLHFTKNTHPSGLTYEEISNYCNNGDSIGIPEFFRNLYCELKRQIDNGGNSINIEAWREY